MSQLALGTVQFGLAYGAAGASSPIGEDQAREILRAAYAAGIRRLDTASAYGDIEQRLAGLIGDLDFEVVSKIANLPAEKGALTRSIARSRNRLGDRLCGLLFHDSSDAASHWDAARDIVDKARLALGVSYYLPSDASADVQRLPGIGMVQIAANAFDQRIVNEEILGVEVTLRSAFLQGLLLMDPAAARTRLPVAAPYIDRWRHWCAAQELSPLDAALSIAKSFDADYVVIGIDNVAQLLDICASWDRVEAKDAPELATVDMAVIDPRTWPRKQ